MKMSALRSELTGLEKRWIRHGKLIEIWGVFTTHHLVWWMNCISFPGVSPWRAEETQFSSCHFMPPCPLSGRTAPVCEQLQRQKSPSAHLFVWTEGCSGNCTFKVQMSVRWEGEQNDWLPFSAEELNPEWKAWLSNHWHKNRMSRWALLMMNLILRAPCPGL